jgi:hypothetical protein
LSTQVGLHGAPFGVQHCWFWQTCVGGQVQVTDDIPHPSETVMLQEFPH